eukprot:CAMPEP_0117424538 /NCGR_PEP_ID=MMETSP0758-20121206/4932_1 /TAXON_ID=63605 /ORGANISM="Percolomonas cosmopolitus, Strain AE-1 (ATCC 50343)" /LENGTH=303 /DNA_ID=CAMNT_0005208367 /DNA_START=218 /DNA_END=1129 /DNA_ORIENTATION=+
MTVNYVEDLLSIRTLKQNYLLSDLHLVGNPCANYPGYRLFVIGTLPQLAKLDSLEITKSERIKAKQQWEKIEKELIEAQDAYIAERKKKTENAPKYNEKGEKLYGNDPEGRKAAAKDLRETVEEAGYNEDRTVDGSKIGELDRVGTTTTTYKRLPPTEEIEKFGKVMQCNEGKWDFKKYEDQKGNLILDIPAGKYMSTAKIDIDVQPSYIQVMINRKELRLRFDDDVIPSKAIAQRSNVTGNLKLTLPLVKKTNRGIKQLSLEKEEEEKDVKTKAPLIKKKKPLSTKLTDDQLGQSTLASIVR